MKKKKKIIYAAAIVLVLIVLLSNLSITTSKQFGGQLTEGDLNIKTLDAMDLEGEKGEYFFLMSSTEPDNNSSLLVRTTSDLLIKETYQLDENYQNVDFSTESLLIYTNVDNELYDEGVSALGINYDSEKAQYVKISELNDVEAELTAPNIELWSTGSITIIDENRYIKLKDPEVKIDGENYYLVDFTQNVII